MLCAVHTFVRNSEKIRKWSNEPWKLVALQDVLVNPKSKMMSETPRAIFTIHTHTHVHVHLHTHEATTYFRKKQGKGSPPSGSKSFLRASHHLLPTLSGRRLHPLPSQRWVSLQITVQSCVAVWPLQVHGQSLCDKPHPDDSADNDLLASVSGRARPFEWTGRPWVRIRCLLFLSCLPGRF